MFYKKEAQAVIDRVRQTRVFTGGQLRNMQGRKNTYTIVLEAKDETQIHCFSHAEVNPLTASEINRQHQVEENRYQQNQMRAQAIIDANLQEIPAMLDAAAAVIAAEEAIKPKRVRKSKIDRTLLPTTSIG